MKFIPILFSTAMVQALLAGRKTQIRRIMKPQIDPCKHEEFIEASWKYQPIEWSEIGLKNGFAYCGRCGHGSQYGKDYSGIKCPYGKVGDILWVRESFITGAEMEDGYHKINEITGDCIINTWYKASSPDLMWWDGDDCPLDSVPWKPSIHMPKTACRIFLQITDIRVERLQDISEEDAMAEGAQPLHPITESYFEGEFQQGFMHLWCDINGQDNWDENPWVWCISFQQVERPDNFLNQ